MENNNTPDPDEKINPPEPIFTVMKTKDPCDGTFTCESWQVRDWQYENYASLGECVTAVMMTYSLNQADATAWCCSCM